MDKIKRVTIRLDKDLLDIIEKAEGKTTSDKIRKLVVKGLEIKEGYYNE